MQIERALTQGVVVLIDNRSIVGIQRNFLFVNTHTHTRACEFGYLCKQLLKLGSLQALANTRHQFSLLYMCMIRPFLAHWWHPSMPVRPFWLPDRCAK